MRAWQPWEPDLLLAAQVEAPASLFKGELTLPVRLSHEKSVFSGFWSYSKGNHGRALGIRLSDWISGLDRMDPRQWIRNSSETGAGAEFQWSFLKCQRVALACPMLIPSGILEYSLLMDSV